MTYVLETIMRNQKKKLQFLSFVFGEQIRNRTAHKIDTDLFGERNLIKIECDHQSGDWKSPRPLYRVNSSNTRSKVHFYVGPNSQRTGGR